MRVSDENAIAAWAALPSPPAPVGFYAPFVRFGDLAALSAISSARDGVLVTGKVGRDLDLEAGRAAARRAAENLLGVLLEAAAAIRRGSNESWWCAAMSMRARISDKCTR